jgi:hypothetical protein
MIAGAAKEFEDTEKMLTAAEELFGPLPVGTLRHPGCASQLPAGRHGESPIDVCNFGGDCR